MRPFPLALLSVALLLPLPLANGDHVKHAGGEDARERGRGHPRWHPRRHPRNERIIPKSRDFH